MQLGIDSHIPDGLLAANVLLREKPHQGVPSWNLALHQGIDERNSTAAIGLRVGQHLNRAWSRYTGKERDAESGLDYFGARYYASNMGRFMSPDWSADPDPVPYAGLENPQSLNLYSYVKNNPLRSRDADGHHEECSSSSSTSTDSSGTIHVTVTLKCIEVADHFWQIPGAWLHNVRQTMDHNAIAHQPPPSANNDQALADINNVMMGLVPVTGSALRAARLRKLFGTEGANAIKGSAEEQAKAALQRLEETKELPEGLTKDDIDWYRDEVMPKAEASPNNPNAGVQSVRGQILDEAEKIINKP